MERLTELKVGQELNIDVLKEWTKFSDISSSRAVRKVLRVEDNDNKFYFSNESGAAEFRKSVWLKGFVEFYNKFYGLDIQPMSAQRTNFEKKDFLNTKLDLPNWETCKRFEELLKSVGIVTDKNFIKDTWLGSKDYYTIFISSSGTLTFSSANGLKEFETGNKIVKWQDYLPESAPIKQTVRPKIDWANLTYVEFCIPDKETQDKLLRKLFDLGYTLNGTRELWSNHLNYWRIGSSKNISGGAGSAGHTLLDYKQLINTNNTPLNNKTDGQKIIVCKPHPTVSRGQRPEGRSTLGKTSKVTIRVGHLRNRAINSEC